MNRLQETAVPRKTITVIMPIRNEAAFIRTSLETVLAQDYPEELVEVIVADGSSTDGTQDIVRALSAEHTNLLIIENRGLIVSTGLNAALARAKGDIIIRVDGHCKVAPDYIRRCVEHLEEDGVDGVGGPVVTVGETRIARVIAAAMSSPFGVGGSAFRTIRDRTMLADTVPFAAYTRAITARAGLYDEELVRNQDDEYNYRIRKLGGKLLLAADVRSEYYSRGSLRSLWRQYFQYGYWKVRVMQKHPRQMSVRQFVPAVFVCSLAAVLLALPILGTPGILLAATVIGAYGIANLVGSLLTSRTMGWDLLLYLPSAFATLHLSYGIGFLVGLVKFRKRWGKERQTRGYRHG